MRYFVFSACLVLASFAQAKVFKIPGAKGSCSAFTFEGDKGWTLKPTRKAGGRWSLLDAKKKDLARFDCGLANTDQKQLTEVESKSLTLGEFKSEKLTVTSDFPEEGQKATEGLITSYTYSEGPLKGLVVMSPEYDASSGLEQTLEKMLASIKVADKK